MGEVVCDFIGIVLFHYLSFFSANVAFFPLACVFAVLHGVCKAEVGVSIQHDANHGAYSKNRKVLHAMQLALDIVGASSFMWKQQHVVGHHAFTNVESIDPDIRCDEKNDVRRVNYMQRARFFTGRNTYILAFLYGLLSFKSCFFDDFSARKRITKLVGSRCRNFSDGNFSSFGVLKPSGRFTTSICLSNTPRNDSYAKLFALWTLTEFTTGWLLAFMFQVAHVTPDVEFFKVDEKTGVISSNKSWAEAQLSSSADFAHAGQILDPLLRRLELPSHPPPLPGRLPRSLPAISAARHGRVQKTRLGIHRVPDVLGRFTSALSPLEDGRSRRV